MFTPLLGLGDYDMSDYCGCGNSILFIDTKNNKKGSTVHEAPITWNLGMIDICIFTPQAYKLFSDSNP